ncbi:Protein of unknown function [Lactobacillus acidophilus DSM 20079 = JCM 1132 = NBRC 13951 = CIP 76.13]|nr:Protein of unknown function [Lactobacillus acidophilus DSM 20079 = JCM 1132 = NBRC 13951 = CIP 76.13]CDF69357.1 Protein of unknown function [Lactobacillus acidophilus CIRM-BIA 442]CDF71112.1 Protein of unknown function [Lactobacillus acidophilus CIRM-BIA 445]CDF74931.1 Protein of unknown function [Lactobacillus acidophilus DSM 20242]
MAQLYKRDKTCSV